MPLGATALGALLPSNHTITTAHGKAFWANGRWVFPLLDPAMAFNRHRPHEIYPLTNRLRQDVARLRHLITVDSFTQLTPWPCSAEVLALLAVRTPLKLDTLPPPFVDADSGEITWYIPALHPMFRTPSAITEMVRRATGREIEVPKCVDVFLAAKIKKACAT